MSIIAEVKCARCDRKYSGVRSRCPYCGARRIGRGKYSEESDNSRGKMLIGILIMAVLVVAAGVLLFTTPATPYYEPEPTDNDPSPPPISDDKDVNSLPGNIQIDGASEPTDGEDGDDDGDADPSPSYEIISLEITYSNRMTDDFSVKVNERVPLRARVEPSGIEEVIVWTSSNPDVFEVVASMDGTTATVTGIGIGNATLTITAGGKEATCIVRGIRGS